MTCKSFYIVLSVYIHFFVNVFSVQLENLDQKETKTQDNKEQRRLQLYKCEDSKIRNDIHFIDHVPSYPFYEMVNIRWLVIWKEIQKYYNDELPKFWVL